MILPFPHLEKKDDTNPESRSLSARRRERGGGGGVCVNIFSAASLPSPDLCAVATEGIPGQRSYTHTSICHKKETGILSF